MLLALHYFLPLVWTLLPNCPNVSHQCVLVTLKCPIFIEYSLTIILLKVLVIILLTLWCLIKGLVQSSHYYTYVLTKQQKLVYYTDSKKGENSSITGSLSVLLSCLDFPTTGRKSGYVTVFWI